METAATTTTTTTTTIPGEILVEILTKLPLRTIARFKCVSKPWKSIIESPYLRRVFVSLHKTPPPWSLMFPTKYGNPITEATSFFQESKTWDLPKSPGSYITPFQPFPNQPSLDYFYRASSNGLVFIEVFVHPDKNMGKCHKSFVGNPVLQQWVEIPQPPVHCQCAGLVTRVDEDGVVTGFKVVMSIELNERERRSEWKMYVYSSESGLWSFKRLVSSIPLIDPCYCPSMSFNGTVYLLVRRSFTTPYDRDVLVAHDFYSHEDDQCRVIPLPNNLMDASRCLTTSGGDVIYIEIVSFDRLRVWKLNDNSESGEWWRLLVKMDLASVGCDFGCFPMAMNSFDSDIIYLWSKQYHCLVSGSLERQEFTLHRESQNCGSSGCGVNTYWLQCNMASMYGINTMLLLSQFVLPLWMDSVPRPPN